MPEHPTTKLSPHPWQALRRGASEPSEPRARPAVTPYAELTVTSNFSFLRGASHPEELVLRAAALGHRAAAIADRNSLAGVVRAHVAAKEAGIPLAVGARIVLTPALARLDDEREEPPLEVLVFATDRASYGRLARLLTLGKRRAEKGACRLALADLCAHAEGLVALAVPPPGDVAERFFAALARLAEAFDDDRLSVAAARVHGPDDRGRLARLARLAERACVPLAATNDVHYHVAARRPLQDVLACVREGRTVADAGFLLAPHAERFLKPPDEMVRLFAELPGAVERSLEIAQRAAAFSLDELRYRYPDEVCAPGRAPIEHLAVLTQEGARERYPLGVPAGVVARLDHELALIDELDYAPYFLTVHDLVRFARSRGILCQGRGAAANSAVCYCLGVTAVDPDRIDLLFERFVSKERGEPPDIDIDFEHERREEVIQYIYAKYGRERAALTAEVITYRGRSAVRDVGKALGLSLDCVERLAKEIDWWGDGVTGPERLRELGLDPADPTLRRVLALAEELLGFPRHLSQHVGGFVVTQEPLCELVPIENAAMADRTVIEWDKDDIEAMGMLKVDVLGLGMLTCVRKTFELVGAAGGGELALHTVPAEDPAVYDMICAADTIGVFQIESRAQMSMLPRLRPRNFYDLVIEVAIVRPGPIQGDMVHPYLRRRGGEEPVTFPSEEVRRVLGRTLGVPLFQEQAMALAMVAGGFTAGEADELRRAMAAWKRKTTRLVELGRKLVMGLLRNGYTKDFAERFFQQIRGFSEYGFPESHAASFALVVYVSAWLKRHHPAAFAAGLLNSQPMGFYAPAQIVRDAQAHGVEVRALDVNRSTWDCTLEPAAGEREPYAGSGPALRLGMRLAKGLRQSDADAIAQAVRRRGPFAGLAALHAESGARAAALRVLARADAFRSMGLDRRAAQWHARALRDDLPPLFRGAIARPPSDGAERERPAALPAQTPLESMLGDYESLRLSLDAHPLSFLRADLARRGVAPAADLADAQRLPDGARVRVAGLVLVRQRPGTAGGILFMTIEDESGSANLIVRPHVFERYRRVVRHAALVLADGRVERANGVVHVCARSFASLDDDLEGLAARSRDFR